MSSSVHVDDKNKDILILGEGPTQDTTLTVEDTYPISFTQPRKSFLLILHFNRSSSSLFVDAAKYINSNKRLWNKRLYTVFR